MSQKTKSYRKITNIISHRRLSIDLGSDTSFTNERKIIYRFLYLPYFVSRMEFLIGVNRKKRGDLLFETPIPCVYLKLFNDIIRNCWSDYNHTFFTGFLIRNITKCVTYASCLLAPWFLSNIFFTSQQCNKLWTLNLNIISGIDW